MIDDNDAVIAAAAARLVEQRVLKIAELGDRWILKGGSKERWLPGKSIRNLPYETERDDQPLGRGAS